MLFDVFLKLFIVRIYWYANKTTTATATQFLNVCILLHQQQLHFCCPFVAMATSFALNRIMWTAVKAGSCKENPCHVLSTCSQLFLRRVMSVSESNRSSRAFGSGHLEPLAQVILKNLGYRTTKTLEYWKLNFLFKDDHSCGRTDKCNLASIG